MAVPLLDIKREYAPIRREIDAAISRVVDHGQFILGPEVKELEQAIANYLGVKHAVGVASGTDALLLSLRACGVGPGDEVITSTFSFFSSASVICLLGAKPVFADIEPDTFNIDPKSVAEKVTANTKAIMPVHLFGQAADMDPICVLAEKHQLRIVEDGAQAIGAKYKGRRVGAIGDIGCFSFFPTKNLGAAGDAGIIVTNDDQLAEQLRMLRRHGEKIQYHHVIIGYNSRLDTIHAAMLLVKLPYLDKWTAARRENAALYNKRLSDLPLQIPAVREWAYHIYNQYTIATERRDELADWLSEKKIGCKIYYPIPFHLQECFAHLGYKNGDFPNSEKAAKQVLSIPVFGEMTTREQDEVISALGEFYKRG